MIRNPMTVHCRQRGAAYQAWAANQAAAGIQVDIGPRLESAERTITRAQVEAEEAVDGGSHR